MKIVVRYLLIHSVFFVPTLSTTCIHLSRSSNAVYWGGGDRAIG